MSTWVATVHRDQGTAGEPRPGHKQDSLQLIRHKSTTSESFKPKLKFWLAGLLAAAPSVSTLLGHCFNFLLNLLYTLQNSIGRGDRGFCFPKYRFCMYLYLTLTFPHIWINVGGCVVLVCSLRIFVSVCVTANLQCCSVSTQRYLYIYT